MKQTTILLVAILLNTFFLTAREKPRKPFIVLKINGKTYTVNDKIPVRAGERITVEAVLMGGRRDYCSNPQKYANVGKNTVIEQYGEDGIRFSINGGQFIGQWSLTGEQAQFSSIDKVKITPVTMGMFKRTARIEVPQSGYSGFYLKVSSAAKWHYQRNTPAGKSEKNEENTANATFNFIITENGETAQNDDNGNNEDVSLDELIGDKENIDTAAVKMPVWYSSRNIVARGMENFSVRNQLYEVQKFYDLIEKYLLKNQYKKAEQQIQNLKNYVGEVNRAINYAKEKNPEYHCHITYIGLPTDIPMGDFKKARLLADKWKERFYICQSNVSKINETLLNYQTAFSANILKSVVKNYINWGSGLPTDVQSFLTLHDPDNIFGIIDLPRNLLGWYQEAQSDAGILANQAKTIRNLSALRDFYLENMANYVNERKKLQQIFEDLSYVKEKHEELEHFFSTLHTASFQPKV